MDNSVPTAGPVSFGENIFRFSWVYIFAVLAEAVIVFVLEAFSLFDLTDSAFLGILPLMAAGFATGQYYASRTGMKPRGSGA